MSFHGAVVRSFVVALLLVPLSVVIWMPVPERAVAANYNCVNFEPFFDGYATLQNDKYNNSFEGADASIENNPGSVCSTDSDPHTNFYSDWVMLAENYGTSDSADTGWVQVGYLTEYGKCTYWFAEYDRYGYAEQNPTLDIHTDDGCRTGTGTEFKVGYYTTNGLERMFENGNVLDTTPFDVHTAWANEPWNPELSAEADYPGSDIPGTSSDTTSVSGIVLQRSDASWTPTSEGLPSFIPVCYRPNRWVRDGLADHQYDFYSKVDDSDISSGGC